MTSALTISNITWLAIWSISSTMIAAVSLAGLTGKHLLAPVQAISHIVFGESAYQTNRLNLSFAATGFILNGLAMIGWSSVAEFGLQILKVAPSNYVGALAIGMSVSLLAYLVDFKVVPKRFTPGFEHVLTRRSVYLVYWMVSLSMALGSLGRSV
jgi:hypothetical protein